MNVECDRTLFFFYYNTGERFLDLAHEMSEQPKVVTASKQNIGKKYLCHST